LLAGGAPAIASINSLDSQLGTASETLGENAATNLYKAGEEAARGLVKGLEDQKKELEKLMNGLATTMVDAIKKKLKIKSPSEVFAKLGELTMDGMAKGFASGSQNVSNAADAAAQEALDAMRKTMREISSVVTDEIDPNPTITPVLDLTQVRNKAAELAALKDRFALDAAYGQAASISSARTVAEVEAIAASGGSTVKFEQNNYSPEALTEVEIYRRTRNQLSQLKSALAVT
jgi:hypothetical protein